MVFAWVLHFATLADRRVPVAGYRSLMSIKTGPVEHLYPPPIEFMVGWVCWVVSRYPLIERQPFGLKSGKIRITNGKSI